MFYPSPQANDIIIYDVNQNPIIAAYVSDAQIILPYNTHFQHSIYELSPYRVILRFPRMVMDSEHCVYVDCNNRVRCYPNDPQAPLSTFPVPVCQSVNLPVYQYSRNLSVSDHQCAPFCPDMPPQAALILAYAPQQTGDDGKAEADEKSKREYQYDRYFTYENKIYSYFTTETGDENVTMLCNFAVYPNGIEEIVGRSGAVTKLLRLIIGCAGQSCNITIQPDQTEKLIKEIQKQIPQAYLNPNEKRAAKQLSAYISMIFEHYYCATIIKTAGWVTIPRYNNRPLFVYANDTIGHNNAFKCETGKQLLWIQEMSQQESFFHAVRMLKLSSDMKKTLPLWLVSHMGVMFSLFEKAGYAPRFVTYLYGSSGSLKTSVSKVFFKILKDDFNDISANFNDTMTALEIKMGSTKDEVLLVDDYRPSALRSEAARMNNNFEKLIRFYGDGIGKGRGNVNLSLRNEFKPMSMCAVTGELLHGTASSLLRLLIIHVGKETYDKTLLKFYQDNPKVFTTHIKYLTDYIAEKHEELEIYIQTQFPKYRADYNQKLTESRLVDAAVCLRITADIVLDMYAKQCGLVVVSDIPNQMRIFDSVIVDTVLESQALACHLEAYDMYLYAMVKSINDKKLIIGDGKQNYRVNGDTAGFIDRKDGYLYIRPQDTYNQVIRYWAALDRPFSATDRSIRQELAIHQFILTQSEESKDNTTRVVRLAGNVERRFLVFDMKKLENRYGKITF